MLMRVEGGKQDVQHLMPAVFVTKLPLTPTHSVAVTEEGLTSFHSSLPPELQVSPVPSVDVLFPVVVAGVVHKHIVHAIDERVEVPNLWSGPQGHACWTRAGMMYDR